MVIMRQQDIDVGKVPRGHKSYVLGVMAKSNELVNRLNLPCLYPGCSASPVMCHSQQRSGILSNIAEQGRVVVVSKDAIKCSWQSMNRKASRRGVYEEVVQKATTFRGYCMKHDTELFKDIETKPLVVGNGNQLRALHIRAVSYELRCRLELLAWLKCNKFINDYNKVATSSLDAMQQKVSEDVKRLATYEWNPLWAGDFERSFDFEWRTLPKQLPISLTTCITPPNPVVSFAYKRCMRMFGMGTVPRLGFTLSIVPLKDKTHIIMIWNKLCEAAVSSYRKRLRDTKAKVIEGFVNECAFCLSEDWCMRPSKWNGLSSKVKNYIGEILAYEDYSQRIRNIPRIIRL